MSNELLGTTCGLLLRTLSQSAWETRNFTKRWYFFENKKRKISSYTFSCRKLGNAKIEYKKHAAFKGKGAFQFKLLINPVKTAFVSVYKVFLISPWRTPPWPRQWRAPSLCSSRIAAWSVLRRGTTACPGWRRGRTGWACWRERGTSACQPVGREEGEKDGTVKYNITAKQQTRNSFLNSAWLYLNARSIYCAPLLKKTLLVWQNHTWVSDPRRRVNIFCQGGGGFFWGRKGMGQILVTEGW